MSAHAFEGSAADGKVISSSLLQRPRSMRRKECMICCTDHAVNQFPRPHSIKDNNHDRGVCVKCWEQYLRVEIENRPWNDIGCADPECEEILGQPEIMKLASTVSYQAWLDKAAKTCQQSDETFVSCPSASCEWGCFISTREDGNIFSCQLCKCRYCVLCQVPMHENETCKAYAKRHAKQWKKENRRSEWKVRSVSKPCPQCHTNLDKYDGCDHITCTICSYDFCWMCFAPYSGDKGIWQEGNGAHDADCIYYPDALSVYTPPLTDGTVVGDYLTTNEESEGGEAGEEELEEGDGEIEVEDDDMDESEDASDAEDGNEDEEDDSGEEIEVETEEEEEEKEE